MSRPFLNYDSNGSITKSNTDIVTSYLDRQPERQAKRGQILDDTKLTTRQLKSVRDQLMRDGRLVERWDGVWQLRDYGQIPEPEEKRGPGRPPNPATALEEMASAVADQLEAPQFQQIRREHRLLARLAWVFGKLVGSGKKP